MCKRTAPQTLHTDRLAALKVTFFMAAASLALRRAVLVSTGTFGVTLAHFMVAASELVDAFEEVAKEGMVRYWQDTIVRRREVLSLSFSSASWTGSGTDAGVVTCAGRHYVWARRDPRQGLQQGVPDEPGADPLMDGAWCAPFLVQLRSNSLAHQAPPRAQCIKPASSPPKARTTRLQRSCRASSSSASASFAPRRQRRRPQATQPRPPTRPWRCRRRD